MPEPVYLIVDAGGWLGGRRVLISTVSFRDLDWSGRKFHLALSRSKIENAPGVEVDLPVSRQHERAYYDYYGYPRYWGAVGMGMYSGMLPPGAEPSAPTSDEASGDVHLRSAKELRGYHIQGTDEAIGHVNDFIVDDETWEVRYLVIDTSNWWFGKKVLIAPRWASRVSWAESKVHVGVSRESIKNSPAWNGAELISREYETRLHDQYDRTPYWAASASSPLRKSDGGQQPRQA